MMFFHKKQESENQAYAPNEEIDVKRTSKLGYFFLILMVLFGLWQGNSFLGALKRSIDSPQPNSACLSYLAQFAQITLEHGYSYGYDYYDFRAQKEDGSCSFSERETALGLDKVYAQILPLRTELDQLTEETQQLQYQISTLENRRRDTTSEYQASLLEDVAKEEVPVFDQDNLQQNITEGGNEIQTLETTIEQKKARMQTLEQSMRAKAVSSVALIQQADAEYGHELTVVEFERFLLSCLFTGPLFFLVWYRYNRSRRLRSEYAIIWGGLVAVVSLIVAEILLTFVYEVLPKHILQQLWALLDEIKILWAVLYWLGFILVPLFFGFLIYIIQKKFYNKRAVMMRALKSEHCPNCSFKINHTMNNCPVCGYTLKSKCTTCSGMSMDGGSFCQVCGARRTPPSTGV